jgi:glycosyltransferase involved in cell wall biosynthesis
MYLSIIIPIFNTEKYLSECIDSCLHLEKQIDNFEIILVDDGSTDSSLSICLDYQYKHSNIKVLSQENQKQGAARNHGLSIAKGNYIWFVDSDDMIQIKGFSKILKQLDNKIYDVICFNGKEIDEQGVFLKNFNRFNKYSNEHKFSLIASNGNYNSCSPLYLFKKDYLKENTLKFLPNIFFEDNEFILRIFNLKPETLILTDLFYVIRLSLNSTTRSVKYERFLDIFNIIDTLLRLREKQILKIDVEMIDILIFRNINSVLQSTLPSKVLFIKACKKLENSKELAKFFNSNYSLLNNIQISLLNKPQILRTLMIIFYKVKQFKL